MAQRVLLVCDLHDDDSPGAETVSFAIDGSSYEVDVCTQHAAALRDAVAPFVGAGRRAGTGGGSASGGGSSRRGRGTRPSSTPDRQRTQEIREWARAHGHQVSDRGRIPVRLVEQFEASR
ncbi:MAG: Lsr2 family protein [Frankiaceae bacterium]